MILYTDNLIIPTQGPRKPKRVSETIADYGLDINFKKCQFLERKIKFLEHIIKMNTVALSAAKIKAGQNFLGPNEIKQLQSFLGLTGYFRKYIPSYDSIARPLSDLLR